MVYGKTTAGDVAYFERTPNNTIKLKVAHHTDGDELLSEYEFSGTEAEDLRNSLHLALNRRAT